MLRTVQLLIVVFRYGTWPLLDRRAGRRVPGPVRLRLALQELGGTWIKLGQVLALRFDLLPQEYCYELFKLLNEVKPFPYEKVRVIITEDLGAPPEQLFVSFEKESFAAASIGQVHRAVLDTGQTVAVKVQRPRVRKLIRRDLRLMYLMAFFVDLTHIAGGVRLRTVIDEFARWTSQELNYLTEARNAYNLRASSASDPLEYDPEVFFELTSERVLTMELIEGIPLIEVMYAMRDGDKEYLRDFEEAGYDPQAIAAHIAWNTLNQIYQQGQFHADLHPANLFVLPGNTIGYVDFGIVGVLTGKVRESLLHYAWNLYQGNVDRATGEVMRWIKPTNRTDIDAARTELARVLDNYLFSLKVAESEKNAPLPTSPSNGRSGTSKGPPGSSEFEVDILNAIRSHGMTVRPAVVTYFKALITANAVIFELDPTFDLLGMENTFFSRLIVGEANRLLDPRQVSGLVFDYGYRLGRALDSLDTADDTDLQEGSFLLGVRRRVQLFAVLLVVAGGALYIRAGEPAPARDWRAVALSAIFVVVGLAELWYGGQLGQTRSRRARLPPRKQARSRARGPRAAP